MTRPFTLALALLLALTAPSARAQEALTPPGPRETLGAYNTLEAWIRDWSVPVDRAEIDPAGTTASSVTLRLSGRVLGRGTSVGDDGASLWRASRAAWIEADASMPVARDALRAEAIREITPRITIELQVAGTMIPILGERYDDATYSLAPGIDGVAARTPARAAAVFPGTMLALGFSPELGLRAATGELDLPPAELGDLRAKHKLTVLRFRARHLAQPSPGEPPIFLHRGSKIVPKADVNGPALRTLARALAEHIMTHDWPGTEPHGMTGDYLLAQGSYDPLLATPRAQAIAADALLRYAHSPGADPAHAGRATVFAKSILEQLTEVTASEPNPLDSPVDAAAWLLADSHLTGDRREHDPTASFRVRALERVTGAAQDLTALRRETSGPERALIACALARAASDEQAIDAARALVIALYQEAGEGRAVALLPWLSLASSALADQGDTWPGAVTIRATRSVVWTHQLVDADLPVEQLDLAGGIVFTRGRNPLPTWQSLKPLASIAHTLDDPEITDPGEFREHFARLASSLRFVMQLTIREPDLTLARDRERSIGGTRTALWEARASLDATSLALLTVCETLESVRNVSENARSAPVPSP